MAFDDVVLFHGFLGLTVSLSILYFNNFFYKSKENINSNSLNQNTLNIK